MRIAIAQLDFTIGAFVANLEQIRQAAAAARLEHAVLLVLSELATTGYPPRDLLERDDFVDENLRQLERIAALSDESLGIVTGYVERNRSGTGKPLHNAAALCHRGRVTGRALKSLLPTYDVFDEDRYFEPGTEVRPVEFRGIPLGLTICEDVWNDPDFWPRRLYHRDPVGELVAQGARLLLNISASPFSLGKGQLRRAMIGQEATKHERYFFSVNQVGAHDELVFDGHSLGVDPTGSVILRAHDFAPDFLVYEVPDTALTARTPGAGTPGTLRQVAASREEEAYDALVLGLADYTRKCGFRKVVIGLSGGIDSSLTAAVAVDALGADAVLGVSLPARYSSEHSRSDARALAENLGIEYREIAVDPIFQAYLDALEPVFAGRESDVTEENIQARVRGNILMAISNKEGRLLLTTGNKSELAVGYCTLYGDMSGGLAVISDVPKMLVYELARWANRERERIPETVFSKPPSAELRADQTDQDSLPPYDVLDRIVEAYVEHNRSVDDMVAEGLSREVVTEVVLMIDRNEYKRRQAAPGIRITSKAFGSGRRYPIAAVYRDLHEPRA